MPESLDVRTIIVILALGHALAALLLFFDTRQRALGYDRFFAISMVLQAAAWALIYLRGAVSDGLSFGLSNSLIFAGMGLEGLCLLSLTRPVNKTWRIVFLSIGACLLVVWWFPALDPILRLLVVGLINPLFFAVPAVLMVIPAARPSPLQKFIGATLLLCVLATMARGLHIAAADSYSLAVPSSYQILFLLVQATVMILASMGYILIRKEFANEHLEMRIIEHKQAAASLRESEDRYRQLVEGAPDIVYEYSVPRGGIFYSSRAVTVLGYPLATLYAQPQLWHDALHPDDRARVERVIGEFQTGSSFEVEYRIHDAQGHWHWFLDRSIGRKTNEDEIIIQGLVTDITERKRVEEALKISESQLRAVLDNSRDAIGVHINGIWEMCNPAALRLFGVSSPEELIGTPIIKVIAPQERSRISDFVRSRMAGVEAPLAYVTRGLRTDGTEFDMDVTLSTFTLESKLHVLVILCDITERKRTEEALRHSQVFLNSIIEHSPNALWISDEHGTLIRMNQACRDNLHLRDEEVVGKYNILKDNLVEAQGFMPLVEDVFKKGVAARFVTAYDTAAVHGLKFEQTTQVVLDINMSPILDSQGKVTNAIIQLVDITGRKRAEAQREAALEARLESERQYRRLIDLLPSGIIVHSAGQILLANDASVRCFGADSPAQLIGTALIDRVHPAYRTSVTSRVQQTAQGENPAPLIEEKLLRLDGTPFDAEVAAMTIVYDNSPAMLAVFNDITKRKQTEEVLHDSEEKYRTVADFTHDWEAWRAPDGTYRYISPACERITGHTVTEFLRDPNLIDLITHPDDQSKVIEHYHTVADQPQEQDAEFDFRILTPSGETRWLSHSSIAVYGEAGQWLGLRESNRDITARKQAEEALRESEQRYRLLFAAEQRQTQELALLDRARTALMRELDLSAVIHTVVEAIADTFGYTQVSLYLIESDQLVLQHQVGYDTVISSIPLTQGIAGRVARTGQAVLLQDVNRAPEFLAAMSGVTSEVCTPLIDQGQVVGILNVESSGGLPLTNDDLQLMTTLSDHIGIAIQHARLYAQAQQELAERIRTETDLRRLKEFNEGIIETVTEGIVIQDLQGRYRYANPAATALLGYTREELLGQHWHAIIPADQWPIVESADQRRGSGVADRYELDMILKNGARHTVLISGSPWYEDGVYAGSLVTFADITERKQAEDALRESQLLYHSLVEVSPLCICRKDLAGRFTFANRRFVTETHLSLTDLLGKTDFDIHPPGLAEKYRRDEQAIIDSGQVQELIEERALLDGEEPIIVQSIKTPIWNGAGQIIGVQTSFWDITARQRAEEALHRLNVTLEQRVADRTAELQAANLRLTELDHLKDEFLSRISHELRTPLTSIKIYVELLESGKPEKRDRYLQTLKWEADRLHALIEDVLMFSQLNLYTKPSTLAPIDLNNVIEGRLTTWQQLSAGHDLTFQLNLAQDLPRARTDGEPFMQALTRLIANAVNYTPTGSITILTACRNEVDQQWVTISVTDTGPGITPEDLPHIFERFYRGRAAADYKTPGTGVGLSISREIIERLGGRLTVDTRVGTGSTFTLWLPVV